MAGTLARSCILLVLSALAALAQGSSSIITLVMPPPGGEGYSGLQSGAATPTGAASLYHNPALLAGLERTTGSQLFFTKSRQYLLPVLELPGIYQDFWAAAAVAPDPVSGTDLGVGFFRNRVNFGKTTQTDSERGVLGTFDSWETVYGLGVGVRLGIPVSIGATAKFIDSHLADGLNGSRPVRGWAFDIGLIANPRLAPDSRLGLPAITITPSIAATARNLGPDVFYVERYQADPIPTTYSFAYGLKAELFDMAEAEVGWDQDVEWTHRSDRLEPVENSGYTYFLLGYRFGRGWLSDPHGGRRELHTTRTLEISGLRIHRIFKRLAHADFTSPSAALDGGYPFGTVGKGFFSFRANPRLVVGKRKIHSREWIRDGQKTIFMAVSL